MQLLSNWLRVPTVPRQDLSEVSAATDCFKMDESFLLVFFLAAEERFFSFSPTLLLPSAPFVRSSLHPDRLSHDSPAVRKAGGQHFGFHFLLVVGPIAAFARSPHRLLSLFSSSGSRGIHRLWVKLYLTCYPPNTPDRASRPAPLGDITRGESSQEMNLHLSENFKCFLGVKVEIEFLS